MIEQATSPEVYMLLAGHGPNPFAWLHVVLVAIGSIVSLHLLHHALVYPFKERIVVWWEKATAPPDEFLPDRPRGDVARLRRRLKDGR